LVSQHEGPVPLVFAFLVLAGMARALGMPARGSLIALVVPVEALGNAVTWSSTGWQLATVAGPMIGGWIIAVTLEPSIAYTTTAVGLLVCIMLAAQLQPRRPPPSSQTRSLRELLAGIRFVWRTELMLAAITLDLFAVLLGGATALLPIYAKEILHVGPSGFGWLRAAPSLGALVMALIMAHRPPLERPGRTLLWAVTGFGVATVVFGVSDDFYLSFAMLALTGVFDNISVVIRGTLMQVLTPDEMRGRVTAVNAVFISSSNQLGAFESGMTAAWFGPIASVVGGGIGTIVVVLTSMLLWPRLRRLEPLHKMKSEG
jgi:MFS family permease